MIVEGAPPAREGAKIVDSENNEIGYITSGLPSPTLLRNRAMGFLIDLKYFKLEVGVVVRGRTSKAVICKMPFVPII